MTIPGERNKTFALFEFGSDGHPFILAFETDSQSDLNAHIERHRRADKRYRVRLDGHFMPVEEYLASQK